MELASNLREVQNVVDTTFGGMSNKINDFAKSAAASYGISELQAKKYSGTLGAMLKSAGYTGDVLASMSTNLTGLAGDLASFYNLNTDEAFDKLKSGISGETEPLKALGVDISDTTVKTYAMTNGFSKQWEKATQAEKELWRYKSIMEQTKDAQGDYNKTSDSFANQLRTLKLNVQNLGKNIMSYTIPAFQNLFKSINDFITKIDIKTFLDNIMNTINKIKPSFDTLVDAVKNLANTIWKNVQPAFDSIKPDNWDSVGDAIKDVLDKATSVVDYINNNWNSIKPIIEGITGAVVAWELAIIAVNTWTKIVSATTKAWETIELIIWGIKNATNIWEGAQWALNVAMAANPVGMVALAIGGLILVVYEVIKHWQDFVDWCYKAWDVISSNPILEFINIVLDPLGTAIIAIVSHWKEICDWVQKAWDKLQGFLDWWNKTSFDEKQVNVKTNVEKINQGSGADFMDTFSAAFNAGTDGNATGTDYWKGGRTWVGEHGKELVDLPSGAKVHTASESKKIASGNGTVVMHNYFTGNVGTEEFFNEAGEFLTNKLSLALNNNM